MTINDLLLQECQAGTTQQIPTLIVRGADPNYRHSPRGQTVLHVAAEGGHLAVVQALATRGGFPNFRDNQGQTPLHYAAKLGHVDIVKYLLEREADALIADKEGLTPLQVAEREGHELVVEALKKAQSSLEEKREKEAKMIEEEQKRIHQLKQIVIEKEKERRRSAYIQSPQTLSDFSRPPTLARHSMDYPPSSSELKGKEKELSSHHLSQVNLHGAKLPEDDDTPGELRKALSEGSLAPGEEERRKEEQVNPRKKSANGFLSKARAISMMFTVKEGTIKMPSAKRQSGGLDKGDKWIHLLND